MALYLLAQNPKILKAQEQTKVKLIKLGIPFSSLSPLWFCLCILFHEKQDKLIEFRLRHQDLIDSLLHSKTHQSN